MQLPINFAVIKNPINWFIVILTIFIGSFALHVILPPSDNS